MTANRAQTACAGGMQVPVEFPQTLNASIWCSVIHLLSSFPLPSKGVIFLSVFFLSLSMDTDGIHPGQVASLSQGHSYTLTPIDYSFRITN